MRNKRCMKIYIVIYGNYGDQFYEPFASLKNYANNIITSYTSYSLNILKTRYCRRKYRVTLIKVNPTIMWQLFLARYHEMIWPTSRQCIPRIRIEVNITEKFLRKRTVVTREPSDHIVFTYFLLNPCAIQPWAISKLIDIAPVMGE